jgi:hypothetical protein
MKLTSQQFTDFISNYKSLPKTIIESYGFTEEEITGDRKIALNKFLKWHRPMEKWLRYCLLNESEYLFELKSSSLKDYRVFAHEKKKLYELIQAIALSKLTDKHFPTLLTTWNCEALFYQCEWQSCEDQLIGSGILGNGSKAKLNKTANYELSKFIHEYFDNPRQLGRIHQKTITGKLVDTRNLEVSELDSRRFVIQESIEPESPLVNETRSFDYTLFMIWDIAQVVVSDYYVSEAMNAYTSAIKRKDRAILNDKRIVPINVIDGKLISIASMEN